MLTATGDRRRSAGRRSCRSNPHRQGDDGTQAPTISYRIIVGRWTGLNASNRVDWRFAAFAKVCLVILECQNTHGVIFVVSMPISPFDFLHGSPAHIGKDLDRRSS